MGILLFWGFRTRGSSSGSYIVVFPGGHVNIKDVADCDMGIVLKRLFYRSLHYGFEYNACP